MTLNVRLVVPEGEIWAGAAEEVIAKTLDGDIGLLTGHSPVIGILAPASIVRILPQERPAGRDWVQAAVGGGGAPGVLLPSSAVSLPESQAAPRRLAARTSHGEVPAVVGRLEGGRLLLDLRSVPPEDDSSLVRAVLAAAASVPTSFARPT